MNDIINSLSAHEWTVFSFCLAFASLFIIPFKGGESALKSILNHFKVDIKRYDDIMDRLQATINGQNEKIEDLEKRLTIVINENIQLRLLRT